MPGGDPALIAVMLENALLKYKGKAFEDFFTQAGISLWGPDFQPWKPQGQFGDFKCDGYHISEKTVFQCYAPERMVASTAASKIQTDFKGAHDHFGDDMQKWVFVHNQKDGLHGTTNTILAELRAAHPDIAIEVWTPDHLIHQLLDLPERTLRKLFPYITESQDFSDATWKLLEKLAQERKASAPEIEVEQQHLLNRQPLDDALNNLSEQDQDVRRRLLGYSRWYEPAQKNEIYEELAVLGYLPECIENNARRLHEANLIIVTENHYLPLNMEICQQAAESLMDEFLQDLEE